ncbi:hypothetical protein QP64_00095, partial [Staphylococcus aureus]
SRSCAAAGPAPRLASAASSTKSQVILRIEPPEPRRADHGFGADGGRWIFDGAPIALDEDARKRAAAPWCDRPSLSRDRGRSGDGVEILVGHPRARILALGRDVAVDELDDRHRRGVRSARAGLDDAAIAAVAVRIARCKDVEQLHQLRVVE